MRRSCDSLDISTVTIYEARNDDLFRADSFHQDSFSWSTALTVHENCSGVSTVRVPYTPF